MCKVNYEFVVTDSLMKGWQPKYLVQCNLQVVLGVLFQTNC